MRLSRDGGWSCRLAPDERIPPPEPLYAGVDASPWAISPGLLAAYVTTARSDIDLRYQQTMWTVERLARDGYLLRGPAEDGLWPVAFEDASFDHAFVLVGNVLSLEDLAKIATGLRYGDSASRAFTFPRADDMKRKIPSGYDEWGRARTFKAEYTG